MRWRDDGRDGAETHDIKHVFIMAGAIPNTGWLNGCLALDDKGFVKTGPDLSSDDLADSKWSLARPPYLLETSRPASLRLEMCAGATSNASHRLSARDLSP